MQWDELSDMEKLAYMQEAYSRLGAELPTAIAWFIGEKQ
jgi:hypothetical protein